MIKNISLLLLLIFNITFSLIGQTLNWLPDEAIPKYDRLNLGFFHLDNNQLMVSSNNTIFYFDKVDFTIRGQFKFKDKYRGVKKKMGNNLLRIHSEIDKPRSAQKTHTYNVYYDEMHPEHEDIDREKIHTFNSDYHSLFEWRRGVLKKTKRWQFNVIVQPDTNNLSITAYNYKLDQMEHLFYNQQLEQIFHSKIPNDRIAENRKIDLRGAGRLADPSGNLLLFGTLEDHSPSERQNLQPYVLFKDAKTSRLKEFIFPKTTDVQISKYTPRLVFSHLGRGTIPGMIFPEHQQLVLFGLHHHRYGEGFFIGRFDIQQQKIIPVKEYPFALPVQKLLANKMTIKISHVLMKKNGDVMILMELMDDAKILNNTTSKFRDIIYLNFNSDNELTFSGSISKTQKQRAPEFASFLATTKDNTVHIVYNAYHKKRSAIASYSISEDGQKTRKTLLPAQKGIYLYPAKFKSSDFEHRGDPSFLEAEGVIYVEAIKHKKRSLLKISF